MKKILLLMLLAFMLFVGFARSFQAQTKSDKDKPKIVAVNTNELETFSYDAGKIKFIASSEDTKNAYAVVELTEMPGYKTAWHQHNNCEEAFYVVEGVLTIKIVDKIYEMPAGSYILIPRGTPHGQGNFTKKPVRLLTTFTPGGFDLFFKDRVELFKTDKPSNPTFRRKFDALREKHKSWVEILGIWDNQK
jgi:quercetin dioxygenase-like cupin family protein